ncbi:MAG TPA: ABC transporter permease [Gemmatimonadaceae bacterium]
MPSFDQLRRLLFPWRSRDRIRAELDDELSFHLDMRTADLMAAGAIQADARSQAEREFGDVEFTRRYCRRLDESGERAVRRGEWLADTWHDVVQALRVLRRSPGFLVIALVTIALGVGANSAIFTVVRGVLLRPLPFANPERLVAVYENNIPDHSPHSQLAAADYVDYRRGQSSLTDIGVIGYSGFAYQGPNEPIALHGLRFSANVFGILGARPLIGRTFAPDDDHTGHTSVVVLSYKTWRDVFGGDSSIVGRSIPTSSHAITVIGVMPPNFTFEGDEQFWSPLDIQPLLADVNRSRKFHNMVGVARLRPGVSAALAESDLLTIARRNERQFPASNTGHLVTVTPLHTALVGDARAPLLVLAGAAACVLLIACANLANLVFTRTLARQRELAIRSALGAGRGRLVRQLLVESLLLAVVGGLCGSTVGWAGTRALLSVSPDAVPPVSNVAVDPWVVAFALALSLGGGLLFGLLPAWAGARTSAERTLRETSRAVAGSRSNQLRRLLVAAQTALTVVLLIGAGLLVRSLSRLQQVELGFDPENVLLASLPITSSDEQRAIRTYETLFNRLRQVPGVKAVGATTSIPLRGSSSAGIHIEGEPVPNGPLPSIGYTAVSDDYFRSLSIPLRRGRGFLSQDIAGGQPRAVVLNDEAVRRFFGGRDPLGTRIQLGPNPKGPMYVVVGVVGDVHQDAFDREPRPIAYTSYRQEGESFLTITMKTAGDPMRMLPVLRSSVRELDRTIPVINVTTMDRVAGNSLGRRKFSMMLLSIFAAVSLLLAIVGTYGVMAYTVSMRTPELGVRIALGATTRNVLSLVVGQSMITSVVGVVLGVAGAALATRAMRGLLYGVAPTDTPTFVLVATVLLGACALAALIPARRATRIDPVDALRRD